MSKIKRKKEKEDLLAPSSRMCTVCGKPISKGRLKALPDTTTCVADSNITPVYGHTFIDGDIDDGSTELIIVSNPKIIEHLENERKDKSFKPRY